MADIKIARVPHPMTDSPTLTVVVIGEANQVDLDALAGWVSDPSRLLVIGSGHTFEWLS